MTRPGTRIHVEPVYAPIPVRLYDWQATFDGYPEMKHTDFSDPRTQNQGRGPNIERVATWGFIDIIACLMFMLMVWGLATFGDGLRAVIWRWVGVV